MGRPAKLEPFNIDTGDHAPIKINPRPYSPVDLAKIKEFIDENLKTGVISESDTPCTFPLLPEVNPALQRLNFVEYCALNLIPRKEAHPPPWMHESLLRDYCFNYIAHINP